MQKFSQTLQLRKKTIEKREEMFLSSKIFAKNLISWEPSNSLKSRSFSSKKKRNCETLSTKKIFGFTIVLYSNNFYAYFMCYGIIGTGIFGGAGNYVVEETLTTGAVIMSFMTAYHYVSHNQK